jgi:hypothetical protein
LVYTGLRFIQGSGLVYSGFWFGLFMVLVWFIQGSGLVYSGFWFIQGSADIGFTVV